MEKNGNVTGHVELAKINGFTAGKKGKVADLNLNIRSLYRSSILFRTRLRNEIYPTTERTFYSTYLFFIVVILGEPDYFSGFTRWIWNRGKTLIGFRDLPRWLQGSLMSGVVSLGVFYGFVRTRQFLLRRLLSYRPWLYGEKSPKVLIWGACLKALSGSNPTLSSSQKILPRLPVPPLSATLDKLIKSSAALLDEKELKEFEKEARDFKWSVGWKLQTFLKIKSWFGSNYVSEWWEKFAYRKSRGSIVTGSNYYGIAQSYWTPTKFQSSRAAVLLHLCIRVRIMIAHEKYPPMILRRMIPLCSSAYHRLLGSVRIPQKGMDITRNYPFSKHVVVNSRGILYKLNVFDSKGQILPPIELEKLFEWIIEDSKNIYKDFSEAERSMPALTTLERDDWAEIREKYLLKSPQNQESLEEIESAICFMVLSELSPNNLSEKGEFCNHVDGKSIWYDKSVTMIVDKNGLTTGVNIEHTVADGSPMCHSWEWIVINENSGAWYTEDGRCKPQFKTIGAPSPGVITQPQRLHWDVDPGFGSEILRACQFSQKQIQDLDLEVYDHAEWGKGEMKKFGISPDACMQAALALAFYRDMGFHPHTYEPTTMRFWLEGRTETIRSCTSDLIEWVKAMEDEAIPKEERIKLLKKAATKHQRLFKEAMDGKGIDRHLFGLYIVSKGLGYNVPFLEKVLSKPWILSTTQSPTQQLEIIPDLDHPYFLDKLSPGGGFMTVCDEGYGCAYIFAAQVKLFFHVSSRKSCKSTDSKRFVGHIVRALDEIRGLFIS